MRSAIDKAGYQKSFDYVNKAIAHTPTVIELYLHKGKLFQRCGNPEEANNLCEEARNLDLADRNLNSHSSKYMLKNDKVQEAHDTMIIFSKDMEEHKFNVHEMAQMWFEWHCG